MLWYIITNGQLSTQQYTLAVCHSAIACATALGVGQLLNSIHGFKSKVVISLVIADCLLYFVLNYTDRFPILI